MGTAAGTHIFLQFGWRPAAALSLGLYAFQILVLLCRGPHCERYTWFGYEGGLESRKSVVEARKKEKEAKELQEAEDAAAMNSERKEKAQLEAESKKKTEINQARAEREIV